MSGAVMVQRWVIHAPNIHTGGGMHLLNALLRVVGDKVRFVHTDGRVRAGLCAPEACEVVPVMPRLLPRLRAEWVLARTVKAGELLLCFHGLPPLLPVRGQVVVFVHNRLQVTRGGLSAYPCWVRLRVTLERCWLQFRARQVSRFIVQTPSMAMALRQIVGAGADIRVVPFTSDVCLGAEEQAEGLPVDAYDFIYVASGEAHKNHRRLIEAWILLKERGLTPSLALTIEPGRHPELLAMITQMVEESGIHCVNLGIIPHHQVMAHYRAAKALIFPSWTESFGLPLLEASAVKLPIIAAELDYVRDVVVPAETFDPHSTLSIARAVERFLLRGEPPVTPQSAQQFAAAILSA